MGEETNRLPVAVEILFQYDANRIAKAERGVVNEMYHLDGTGQCFTAFKKRLVYRVSLGP